MTEPSELRSAPRSARLALAVLLTGALMALLDTTIVDVALPAMYTGLGASGSTLSWVFSGYLLAYGLALVPAGRVGDRYGHRPVFLAGLILFTAASTACALAQDDLQLILARAVQGLAAGIFYTAITALIQLMFPGELRGRAFAVMGATIGVSTALGPLAGGLISEHFGARDGWRYIFGVNLPIGVLAVIAALWLLPPVPRNERRVRTDWIGFVLLTTGLVSMLVPLIQGQERGWPLWSYLLMLSSPPVLVCFALWERRVAGRGGEPLVPPRLFRSRAFTGGVVPALVYFAAFTGILVVPLLAGGVGSGLFIPPNMVVSVAFVIVAFALVLALPERSRSDHHVP
ncbi:MFS transporter [Spongiactinospora sp. TRM90649]|uniref:MFS transporter n=1 Tax=Spongiactinospora sp. TRM90649 TaxID=3031114 RepID=UPI0023F8F9B9|nr:MFS transporter [Spongiactinospora sp. TRM90649]MDF5753042.1 MFS transporter [Spongiactinospora sp. TRM90649]